MSRAVVEAWLAAESEIVKVKDPVEAAVLLLPLLTDNGKMLEVERLAVLGLGRGGRLVATTVLTSGNDAHTVACPRQIYRWALTQKKTIACIVVGHNHPSGDARPSVDDVRTMKAIRDAGNIIGIEMVDAIVIGDGDFTSMAQNGDLE